MFGVRRMVHMSSEETSGHFQADRIDENHPQHPVMTYGISKVAVEQLGRSYAQRYGIECLNVRACWVYGPDLPRARVPNTLVAAPRARPSRSSLRRVSHRVRQGVVTRGDRGDPQRARSRRGPFGRSWKHGVHARVWKKGALDISRAGKVVGYRPRYDIRAGLAATLEGLSKKQRG